MRILFVILMVVMGGIAHAEVEVINFDNLTPEQLGPESASGIHTMGFSLDLDGFNFTNTGNPIDAIYGIGTWAKDHDKNPNPGGHTLWNANSGSVTTMTRLDGLPFSVASIDFGNFSDRYASAGAQMTISADLLGGTTVSKTVQTDVFLGLETLQLNWWGVTALHLRNDTSWRVTVDNIVVQPQPPTPAPEPAALPNQITMDFENITLPTCNPCEVYGFSFANGFFGGVTPGSVSPRASGTGESLYAIPFNDRHFLMTQKNGREFGLESIDLAFVEDDYYYYLSDEWILRGYDANNRGIVELRVKRPTNESQWVSVALDPIWHSGLTKVEIFAQETLEGDYAFIDNLVVNLPATEVDFDVQPWSVDNNIDPASKNSMPTAIYTTSTADGDPVDFDALLVDPATVKFGYGEAPVVNGTTSIDLDGDSDDDLLFGFAIPEAGIICEDEELTVTGETFDGEAFFGVDSINTTNCETSSCHP